VVESIMAILAISSKTAVSRSVATGKLGYVRGLTPLISSTQSAGTGNVYYKLLSGAAAASSWASGQMAFKYPIDGRSSTQSGAFAVFPPPLGFIPPTSGPQGDVTVQLLDKNLIPKMAINFVSLNASLYYNAVGSWSLVAPFDQQLWNYLMAGDTIIEVDWRGMFKFGGKCEQPGFQDSVPGANTSGAGQSGPYITMSGADYLALIANRIVYPDSAHSWATQTGNVDIETNVRVEEAIKYYVGISMGGTGPWTALLANRKVAFLNIAPNLLRGNLITYTVKFLSGFNLNMLDIVRTLIVQGGGPTGMGVQITRNGQQLVFDVYVPRDLSGKAWFSKQLGNLTSVQLYITDPTCTNALVKGSATYVEKVAASRTIWNVVEVYSDQMSETDANNVNANAQLTLLQGGFGPLMNATVTDTPYLTFGRDYYLGDIVTVEAVPGTSYADVVTSVALSAQAGQSPIYTITPTVGHGGDATSTDQSIIGQLISRVRRIEQGLSMP
jgi:hypothetical protein